MTADTVCAFCGHPMRRTCEPKVTSTGLLCSTPDHDCYAAWMRGERPLPL